MSLLTGAALAQNACFPGQALGSRSGFSNLAQVIPNAQITVSPGPIFTSATSGSTVQQPLISDQNGNYNICATPGTTQTVTVVGAGQVGYTYQITFPSISSGASLSGNNSFTGSNTFTGSVLATNIMSLTNAGVFTDTQNDYLTSNIGGINFAAEFQALQGAHGATEGLTGGVKIPSLSTVLQANGVAGYVNNASTGTNAVGVYGSGRGQGTNTFVWGGNFVASDGGFSNAQVLGTEVDIQSQNAASQGSALIFNGTLQPNNLFAAITIPTATAVGAQPWQNGIQFLAKGGQTACKWCINFTTGATLAPQGSTSAIVFNPVASGTNQVSQGPCWVSNDPVSGQNVVCINLDGNGHLLTANTKMGVTNQLPVTGFVSSTYSNSTTGFTSIPLTATMPASSNQNYTLTCHFTWHGSAATTGPKFQVTAPTGTTISLNMTSAVTATTGFWASANGVGTSQSVANTGTITSATDFPAVVTAGLVVAATPGTFTVQAAANGAGTLVIDTGSYCVFQ